MHPNRTTLDAALSYAAHGFAVFPCHPRDKAPAVKGDWLAAASRDPAQITAWWRQNPAFLIGLPMRSVGAVVVDADTKDGGTAALPGLLERFGLAGAPQTATRSGGSHVWLAERPETPTHNSGRKVIPGIGIDVRGTAGRSGGYVIAPGSVALDGTGWRAANLDAFLGMLASRTLPPIPAELQALCNAGASASPDDEGHKDPVEPNPDALSPVDGFPLDPSMRALAVDRVNAACAAFQREAGPGNRNAPFNVLCMELGAFVWDGLLASEHAEFIAHDQLAHNGGDWGQHGKTFFSGFGSGYKRTHGRVRDVSDIFGTPFEPTAEHVAAWGQRAQQLADLAPLLGAVHGSGELSRVLQPAPGSPIKPRIPIVEGVAYIGHVTTVSASPGAGKTTLIQCLAAASCAGVLDYQMPSLPLNESSDLFMNHCAWLYVGFEGEQGVDDTFAAFGPVTGANPYRHPERFNFLGFFDTIIGREDAAATINAPAWEAIIKNLRRVMTENPALPVVVVIDNAITAVSETSDESQMKKLMVAFCRGLIGIDATRLAVIVITHPPKSTHEGEIGSGAMRATADVALTLATRTRNADGSREVVLLAEKTRLYSDGRAIFIHSKAPEKLSRPLDLSGLRNHPGAIIRAEQYAKRAIIHRIVTGFATAELRAELDPKKVKAAASVTSSKTEPELPGAAPQAFAAGAGLLPASGFERSPVKAR